MPTNKPSLPTINKYTASSMGTCHIEGKQFQGCTQQLIQVTITARWFTWQVMCMGNTPCIQPCLSDKVALNKVVCQKADVQAARKVPRLNLTG